jgi:hypothetical protein
MIPAIPSDLKNYFTLLIPLAVTSMLQRFEFMIDNRFVNQLSESALKIHAIQNTFFSLGQALGLATATSALIFWNSINKGVQRVILKLHVLLALGTGAFAALLFIPYLSDLVLRFQVPTPASNIASLYLLIGLSAIPLQAAYVTINAILIGNDQRLRSTLLISIILILKFAVGYGIVTQFHHAVTHETNIDSPMFWLAISNALIVIASLIYATLKIYRSLDTSPSQKETIPWMQVWLHELWFSVVRAYSPFLLSLLIAQISHSLIVTFQFTANIAYFFCLPIVAGNQVALRDAATEQAQHGFGRILPLSKSRWFPNYFYSSFLFTELCLLIAVILGPWIIQVFYGYKLPEENRSFVIAYFLACIVGQAGHMFAIQLRSARLSKIVSRNLLFSEVIIQLVACYLLVRLSLGTPLRVAVFGTGAYCLAYLCLNFHSASKHMREATS